MRAVRLVAVTIVLSIASAGSGDEQISVRVRSDVDVEVRKGDVRVRVGAFRIRVRGSESDKDQPKDSDPELTISRFLSDRQLIEAPVFSSSDKQSAPSGHVEDFVVDTRTGEIRYAAIAFPDSTGEKLFAIPINSLELDRHQGQLRWYVDVDRDTLAKAPGFSRKAWPDIANRRWAQTIDIYYGVVIKEGDFKTNFGADAKPLSEVLPLERASRLVGLEVHDAEDVRCGTVERLIMDRATGLMRYLAVAPEETASATIETEQRVCVPMTAARRVPVEERSVFVLSVSADRFRGAPRVHLDRVLKPGHVDWASAVDAFFGVADVGSRSGSAQ